MGYLLWVEPWPVPFSPGPGHTVALSPDPNVTPSKVQGIVRRMSASLSRPREDEGFTHILHCTEESDVPARGSGGGTFSRSGAVARVLELAQL